MPGERPFQIALCILYTGFTIIRIRYRRRRPAHAPAGDARLLGALIAYEVTTFVIYVAAARWLAWAAVPLWPLVRWSGFLLGLVSLGLFVWVHRSLGSSFSRSVHVGTDHILVTDGPYWWVRHPMYGAFYLLHVAAFLMSANWFIGLTWIGGLTWIVVTRIPREEELLVERFGAAYVAYTERTPRFLPRLTRRRVGSLLSFRRGTSQDEPQ